MADELSNVNGGSSTDDNIPVTVQSADVTSRSEGVVGNESIVVTTVQTGSIGRNIRPRGTLPPIQPPLTTGWPPYGLAPGYTPPVSGFAPHVRFGDPQQHYEYSRDYNVGSTSNAANSMAVYRQHVEESHHDLVNLLTQQMTTILNPIMADHESKFERLARQVKQIARIVDYEEGERHNARGNNEGFENVFQNENNIFNRENPHIIPRGQNADEILARLRANHGGECYQVTRIVSRCYVSLPESEVVKIAVMGLGFYMRRKLLNVHIPNLVHLAEKDKHRNEQKSKSKPFTRKEKVAYITMESSEEEFDFETEIDLAELKKGLPYFCSLLRKLSSNEKSNESKLKVETNASFIEPCFGVNMVGMSYDFDMALDDFESQVRSVHPRAGDGLLDFLVQQKIKDRDVSLSPCCNAVFDAETAAIFEKERMKKELAHREESSRSEMFFIDATHSRDIEDHLETNIPIIVVEPEGIQEVEEEETSIKTRSLKQM
ncbi:hypothetical protein Ahy_B04g069639 [Arachis hypogaea]|uniref:Uncharacterized protein n=1 Tax=Arachis hypogaea TaxID=3818 RepID=A0A444ZD52_ARAHY|nr:hypothetical protein Ahy_B04g069639 [Arachis hypogaea]